MQRQSLGSPGSKHHHPHAPSNGGAVNGEKIAANEPSQDSKRLSLATSALTSNGSTDDTDDEEKAKLLKSYRSSPVASKHKSPEKLIHGIPILTFVCFLILYLSSHDPSQSELAAFGVGFKRPEVVVDSRSASGLVDGGGEVVANRRLRNLRESQRHPAAQAAAKSRVHRKFGDF